MLRGSEKVTLAVVGLVISLGCSEAGQERTRTDSASSGGKVQALKSTSGSPGGETDTAQAELIARGRSVYVSNCSACHNPDPQMPGSLGPDVAGSSEELLEARLIRNSYPQGYTPKRDSRVMMALPYLKDDIGALAAYLSPLKPKKPN